MSEKKQLIIRRSGRYLRTLQTVTVVSEPDALGYWLFENGDNDPLKMQEGTEFEIEEYL